MALGDSRRFVLLLGVSPGLLLGCFPFPDLDVVSDAVLTTALLLVSLALLFARGFVSAIVLRVSARDAIAAIAFAWLPVAALAWLCSPFIVLRMLAEATHVPGVLPSLRASAVATYGFAVSALPVLGVLTTLAALSSIARELLAYRRLFLLSRR